MAKLILLAVLAAVAWKMLAGRWPWQAGTSGRDRALARARDLLGVHESATREDIVAAHRRLLTMVHPDRGGSSAQVHEANAARDVLLDALR